MTKSQREQIIHGGASLLKVLNGVCVRKVEGWWTYEVCMNEKVRQYHSENQPDPTKKGQFVKVEVNSYVLGKYDSEISNAPPPPPPPTKKKNDKEKKKKGEKTSKHPIGYNLDITDARPVSLLQTFQWGTPCDLTHKPRETTLEFSCGPNSKYNTFIENIQEIATCKYHVKITSPLLCTHEAFQDPTLEKIKAGQTVSQVETIKCHPLITQDDEPSWVSVPQVPPISDMLQHEEVEVLGSGVLDSEMIQQLLNQAALAAAGSGEAVSATAVNVDLSELDADEETIMNAMRELFGDNVETIVLDQQVVAGNEEEDTEAHV